MEANQILEDIGLTKNETKVYLALLSLGQTTTGPIIKRTSLHTSKVYDALERLTMKGIVSHIIQANTKYFSAVDPSRLNDFLLEKKKKISMQELEIQKLIPFLRQKQKSEDDPTYAEIFRGWAGMETVYKMLRETLKKGETNYVFGAGLGEEPDVVLDFFTRHNEKMGKKGLKLRIIFNDQAKKHAKVISKMYPSLFKAKFIEHATPAEINIWSGRVIITILSKKPTIILIKDKNVYNSFLEYFNVMWAIAKE
jgi:sugar-specific transcriptional regulator TrmB